MNVVHNDIKPENIMVNHEDNHKFIDLNLIDLDSIGKTNR